MRNLLPFCSGADAPEPACTSCGVVKVAGGESPFSSVLNGAVRPSGLFSKLTMQLTAED